MDLTSFVYPISLTVLFAAFSAICYYHFYPKRDIATATVIFSPIVFCIVYFVSFENNIGLGIGLLGILSLIRLRSTPENLIDISFVFYSITIGLLNASIDELQNIIVVDVILTTILLVLASSLVFKRRITTMRIVFDDLNFEELHSTESLKHRIEKDLNLEAIDARVTKVDNLKDCVTVKVTYELK